MRTSILAAALAAATACTSPLEHQVRTADSVAVAPVEFAGFVPHARRLLIVREVNDHGRFRRRFEELRLGLSALLAAAALLGAAVLAVLALVHAVFSVTLRADQIVGGVAINLLALGITVFGCALFSFVLHVPFPIIRGVHL